MAAAAFFNAAKLADAVGRISPVVGNIFRYLATKVTGADDDIVTGTAGTSGNVAMWNADGDVVDGSVAASSLTAEAIQDLVGAMVTGNTETFIAVTYQDADGTLDFEITAVSGVDATLVTGTAGTSGNLVQWNADGDAVDSGVSSASIITSHTTIQVDGVAVSAGAVVLDFDGTDFTLTESPTDDFDITIKAERIQDIVGAMVTGNTETLITVTYQDADGTLDFEITDAGLAAVAAATITAVSGADATLITGTEGTSGNVAMWNADGDLVDGSVVAANILVDGDIGSAVQAYDAQLADIAALAVTDGNIIVGNGTNWVAESGATARASLGLGTGDSPVFTGVTLNNTGLHLLDTNASHDLIIAPGSDLAADRTLTITTGDADRTLTLSGNLTVSAATTLTNGTHSGTNTGDQTISLTGDVTGSGTGSFAATIANDAVTYAKIQNVSATARLLGRTTAGAGDVEEIAEASLKSTFNLEAGTDFHAYTSDGNTILTDAGVLAVATAAITAVSGADATLITGTEGTSGNLSMWNADGDLVDASIAAADVVADGDTLSVGLTFPNSDGLYILDNDGSHALEISLNSNLTAARKLTLITGDSDRGLSITADTTLSGGTHSGTNTGNVTLAGTPDYITISGQVITRNQVDLAADVTGTLPVANGGTGLTETVGFFARLTGSTLNKTGNGTVYTIIFNTEEYDHGADYNSSTGVFTAPVDGDYLFIAAVRNSNGSITNVADVSRVNIVSSNITVFNAFSWTNTLDYDDRTQEVTGVVRMEAGDTCEIQYTVTGEGADTVDLDGNATVATTYFMGHLLAAA